MRYIFRHDSDLMTKVNEKTEVNIKENLFVSLIDWNSPKDSLFWRMVLARAIVYLQYLLYILLLLLLSVIVLGVKPQDLPVSISIHYAFSLLVSSVLNPVRVEQDVPEIWCSSESRSFKHLHLKAWLKQVHLGPNHAQVWKAVLVDWKVFQAPLLVKCLEVYLRHLRKLKWWLTLHLWKLILLSRLLLRRSF